MGALTLHRGVSPTRAALELPENLSEKDWLAVGARLKEMEQSILWWVGDWARYGERRYGLTYEAAQEATGLAVQTLKNAAWVAGSFETSRRRDDLSFSHHAEVARLEPRAADELLDHAAAHKLSQKAFRQEVAHYKRRGRLTAGNDRAAALAGQNYRIIYADPPWRYERQPIDGERAIETHYPTMALDEIKALPVPEIAAEDAVLFLWATAPNLEAAIETMTSWDFEYRSHLIWTKDQMGTGYWVRNQHELLLIGVRGDMPPPEEAHRPPSVLRAARTAHSAKPTEVRDWIDAAFADDLTRIELFARGPAAPGWDVWGNEAEIAA